MLGDRDAVGKVNMRASVDDFSMDTGVSNAFASAKILSGISVVIPFISNSRFVKKGELLLLPYDGCIPQICCSTFPSMEAISQAGG